MSHSRVMTIEELTAFLKSSRTLSFRERGRGT